MNSPRFLLHLFAMLTLIILISSCSEYTEATDIETNLNGEYAVPLVNTKATIVKISENSSDNTSVRIDPDGKVTVLYVGNVVEKTSREVFPVVPLFFAGIPILDSIEPLKLPFSNFPDNFRLETAIFKDVKMLWRFESQLEEDIDVTVTIPGLVLNGVTYEENFVLKYEGTTPVMLETPAFSIDQYELSSDNNEITVIYDARTEDGERILLDDIQMAFDKMDFSYIEGFFGEDVQPVQEDVITVGVYSNWLSGGLVFEDPKVSFLLENAFGFPVKAEFNSILLTNLNDVSFPLQSDILDVGVYFSFPPIDKVGSVASDTFYFDTNNSNIEEIFKEKVNKVSYNVNAVANPADDPTIIGFITDSSYYKVNVAVELPLLGYANDLRLTDTFDIDLNEYDNIVAAEFKLILENDFPFDVAIQAYFINKTGSVTDSLFTTEPYFIPAATIGNNGTTISAGEKTVLIPFDKIRYDGILAAQKIAFVTKLVSLNNGTVPLWIYADYGVELRLGAKLKLNK